MTRSAQDIEMWEGEYKTVPFTIVDENDAAVNLTGATLTWVMCVGGPDGEVILTKTTPTNVVVTSAATGVGHVVLAESDTVNRGGDTYYHEMVTEDASGHSEVSFYGENKINKSAIL